jgi:hypothetical protein
MSKDKIFSNTLFVLFDTQIPKNRRYFIRFSQKPDKYCEIFPKAFSRAQDPSLRFIFNTISPKESFKYLIFQIFSYFPQFFLISY